MYGKGFRAMNLALPQTYPNQVKLHSLKLNVEKLRGRGIKGTPVASEDKSGPVIGV
jgi:hypothetical protein